MVIVRNIKKKAKKRNNVRAGAAKAKANRVDFTKFLTFLRRTLKSSLVVIVVAALGFGVYSGRGYLLSAVTAVAEKAGEVARSVNRPRPEKPRDEEARSEEIRSDDSAPPSPTPRRERLSVAAVLGAPEFSGVAETVSVALADAVVDTAASTDTAFAADTIAGVDAADLADTVSGVEAAVVEASAAADSDTVIGAAATVSADTAASVPAPAVPAVSGSFVLPDLVGRLADRDDLRVSLSVELFYGSEVLREELQFKRGALAAIVLDVVRGYEFGNVSAPRLRADLLRAFNGILAEGQLSNVDVRDFRVAPAAR